MSAADVLSPFRNAAGTTSYRQNVVLSTARSQACSFGRSRRDPAACRREQATTTATLTYAAAPRAASVIADVAGGMCFDPACQQAADRAFLVALVVPIAVFLVALVYFFRPYAASTSQSFEDPETGAYFETEGDQVPERDRFGKLAYRAISYTPWPVEEQTPGERLRIAVGPKDRTALRTFVFERMLAQPSQFVSVSLPRPTGIILEEDSRRQRVVVAGFVEGSPAQQRSKVGALQEGRGQGSPQPGDVLRACTCTTIEYTTSALFGAKPATKMITLYGADGQTWPEVMTALRRGAVEDGEVTLVFERYAGNIR